MTSDRKNEIWEYLPNDIRIKLKRDYIKACEAQELDSHNERIYVHRMFMRKYFGKNNMEECKELNDYNLIAQAEEKPKEPRFKVGEKVFVKTSKNLSPRDIDLFRRSPSYVQGVSDKGMATVAIVERHSVTIPIEDIVPWVDGASADSVEPSTISQTNSQTEKNVDYALYRLDLAKGIAVAMINSECDWDVSNCAVSYANEIVKRLKETEE